MQVETSTAHAAQPLDVLGVPDALLKLRTVVMLTGLSRATLYRKVKAGEFVQPIKLSPTCTRWRAGDVKAWLQAQGGDHA